MCLDSYNIVYILGNAFMAYVIYKFMYIFYSKCRVNILIEKIAYFVYFILITTVHMLFEMPLVVMVSNIFLFFLLALLYEGTIKKGVLTVVFIYFSLMSVETIFVFLTSAIEPNLLVPFEYKSEFGIIVIRILSFVLVLLVQGFKNVKNNYPIPNFYWMSLLVIPASTIIMLFAIFINTSLPRYMILVCMISALAINIFTFYLYDRISSILMEQMNKRIMDEQNHYYKYQLHMMKSALENIRIFRHDFKNKLSSLYSLAVDGNMDELIIRLAELTDFCCLRKEYSKSGNSTVDSIINFKLQQAESIGIEVTTDILIPAELVVPTFDIAVILGNLLDNALESVVKAENRWIYIKVKYTKGRLITEINNSYDGIVKKNANHYLSQKQDSSIHGLGIKSVEKTLQKYNGTMQITDDEKRFKVKLLMYL